MSEVLLAHILESLGTITQRLNSIETTLYSDDDSDDPPIKFTYPVKSEAISESNIASTNQLRYIKNTMYDVKIVKPYNDTTHPLLLDIQMTRDELDEFIGKDPGNRFGEFIVSVRPTYEAYL